MSDYSLSSEQIIDIEIARDFLREQAVEKRLSEHTLKTYQRALQGFIEFLEANKIPKLSGAVAYDIQKYLGYAREKGLKNRSLILKIAVLRAFYKHAIQAGHLTLHPLSELPALRADRLLPKAVDVDILNEWLDKLPTDTPLLLRDKAMFELFYSSGIRLSELVALNLQDIDLAEGWLLVKSGKGGADRRAPIGSRAVDALKCWLKVATDLLAVPEDSRKTPIFINQYGARISPKGVQYRLKEAGKKQGLALPVHPHMFRHSAATHVLESSKDLRLVQEFLGHASLKATEIYTEVDFEYLASTYEAAHPLANDTE